jgi:hypothetical protein
MYPCILCITDKHMILRIQKFLNLCVWIIVFCAEFDIHSYLNIFILSLKFVQSNEENVQIRYYFLLNFLPPKMNGERNIFCTSLTENSHTTEWPKTTYVTKLILKMRSDKLRYKSKWDSEYLPFPFLFLLHILVSPMNRVSEWKIKATM